jgi:hypothetical protein
MAELVVWVVIFLGGLTTVAIVMSRDWEKDDSLQD